jgi:hypothetical protein
MKVVKYKYRSVFVHLLMMEKDDVCDIIGLNEPNKGHVLYSYIQSRLKSRVE